MTESDTLHAIARAITQGAVVDWDKVESSVDGEELREMLRELKVIAAIAELHGSDDSASTRTFMAGPIDDPDILPTADSWGPLELLEHVADGSFGEVYRARDTRLDREVALKLLRRSVGATGLHQDSLAVEEARLLARVRHPNVVTIYGADRINERIGLWMEFVHGRTLEQVVANDGPLTATAVARIGVEICRGLAAVHDAGLLHRDIKAHNVMQETAGRLVLMDLGAGHDVSDSDAARELAGTPLYLAPEILEGEPATIQSDIYSVGVVIYYLSTGTYPVSGQTVREIREQHRAGGHSLLANLPSTLPESLSSVIKKALAPDPLQRYGSAGELAADLERSDARSNARLPRYRTLALSVGVVGAVVAGIGALAYRTPSPPRPADSQTVGSLPGENAPASAGPVSAADQPTGPPPFHFDGRDWALIAEFENRTGEAVLDGTLEVALERELANSAFVNVVPRDRIEDVLRLMLKPTTTRIDAHLGREICLRDGHIRALIEGRIDKIGAAYSLTSRIVDARNGEVVATLSDDANTTAALLPALRRQALRVRETLGEMLSTIRRSESALEHVTTPSLHALQLYSQASAFMHGEAWNDAAAEPLLRQAVTEDPAFASAHILLAWTIHNQHRPGIDFLPFAERAREFADRTSDSERYFILGSYHALMAETMVPPEAEVQRHAAASAYEALLRIKPDHYWGVFNLYSEYNRLGESAKALHALAHAADIRSSSAEMQIGAWATFLKSGDLVRSRAYERRAKVLVTREFAEQYPYTARKLRLAGVMEGWLQGDPSRVRAIADSLRREGGGEDLRWVLAHVYMGLGRLHDAQTLIQQLSVPGQRDVATLNLLSHRTSVGDEEAKNQLETALASRLVDFNRFPIVPGSVFDLIQLGRLDDVRRGIARFNADGPNPPDVREVLGQFAAADGQLDRASALLDSIRLQANGVTNSVRLSSGIAESWRARGELEKAIKILQENARSGWFECVAQVVPSGVAYWIHAREQLADLYRDTGRVREAHAVDVELLKLLSEADPDHPVLARLKEHLSN